MGGRKQGGNKRSLEGDQTKSREGKGGWTQGKRES